MASHQVFCRNIRPIHVQKCHEKYQRRNKHKNRKNGRKSVIERTKVPMVVGNSGDPGSLDFRRKHIFGCFFTFWNVWPLWFSKKIDFHGSAIETRGSSLDTPKLSTDRPRKHIFCLINWKIDRTDGTNPLVTINVWSYTIIPHQSEWKSIGDQGFLHCG